MIGGNASCLIVLLFSILIYCTAQNTTWEESCNTLYYPLSTSLNNRVARSSLALRNKMNAFFRIEQVNRCGFELYSQMPRLTLFLLAHKNNFPGNRRNSRKL